MKKRIRKIFNLFIMIICVITLSGCALIKDSPSGKDIDTRYGLLVNEIDEYENISDINVATTVANIVMPATVEINCTINFSYKQITYGFFGSSEMKTKYSSESCKATGIIINESGYLLTNAHVVTVSNEANYYNLQYESYDIKLNYADNDASFKAEVVTVDSSLDLAILKMDVSAIDNVQYAIFYNLTNPKDSAYQEEDANKLYYGETCIAIGNANGYGMSVTKGVVSAPVRFFEESSVVVEAIQTDAAINPGNSGGPLCNAWGAIIGINSFKIVTTSSENLGYAIPSNVILKYINDTNTNLHLQIKYYYTDARAYTKEIKTN